MSNQMTTTHLVNRSASPVPLAGSGGGARAGDAGLEDSGKEGDRSGVPLTQIERLRLPHLIQLHEHEIDNVPLVLERLHNALRGEQRRARAGHWTADPNRIRSLLTFIKKYEDAMPLSHGMEQAYFADGRLAYRNGCGIADCPHAPKSQAREAWLKGWQAERDVAAEEKRQNAIASWRGLK